MSEQTITTFQVPAAKLYELTARVKLAAAKPADGYPVLAHLRLTIAAGTVTAVATDRYRLFIDSISTETEGTGEFLIPATAADDFKKQGFAKSIDTATITWDTSEHGTTVVTVATTTVTLTYRVDEMDYPKVEAIMTKAIDQALERPEVPSQTAFNPVYLAEFAKVAKIGVTKNLPLTMHLINNSKQLLATFAGTTFFGLLMSVHSPRDEEVTTTANEALKAAKATLTH